MSDDIVKITSRAREISDLIKGHDITVKYLDSIEQMKKDKKAQDLHARLVMLGRDINEKISRGETITREHSQEYQQLENELKTTPRVKDHITCQKEYLEFIHSVVDRIKNPADQSA